METTKLRERKRELERVLQHHVEDETTPTPITNRTTTTMTTKTTVEKFQKWNQCTNRLKQPILNGIMKVAKFSAQRPLFTVITCIVISLLIVTIGFSTNFVVENEGDILWTPTDCISLQHGYWTESEVSGFPQPAREVQVLIHAEGENILSLEGITKLFQAVDTIRSTRGYHELCALGRRRDNDDGTTIIKDDVFECPIVSATGLWEGHNSTLFHEMIQTDEDAIDALSQMLYPNNEGPVDRSLIYGQPLPALPDDPAMLYDMDFLSSSSSNSTSSSMQEQQQQFRLESVSAYLATISLPPMLDDALAFELDVTNRLKDLREEWAASNTNTPHIRLEINTFRAFDDELNRGIAQDIPLMGAAFLLMGTFCAITLGRWNDAVQSQSLLGVGGVCTIFLALITGYGLMGIFGVPFTSLTQIFPYVMVGIGLDDTFIITGAFVRTDPTKDIVDRIEDVMNEVGISISVSTLTTFVAFMLGGSSSVPGMRWFSWYAGPTVAIDFIYQITFFIAILALDDQRKQANRRDCCPCCLGGSSGGSNEVVDDQEEEEEEKDEEESSENTPRAPADSETTSSNNTVPFLSKMIDSYSTLLLKPFSKGVVLVVFTAMVIVGSFQASKQTQEFDWRDLIPPKSFLRDFFYYLDTYVGQQGNTLFFAAYYFRDIDISVKTNQDAIFAFVDDMIDTKYITTEPPNFWLRDFLDYANQTEEIQNLTFYGQLDEFLSTQPYDAFYKNDIVRNEEKVVTASRVPFLWDAVSPYDNEQQIEALAAAQSVARRQPLNSNLAPTDWKLFSLGGIYYVWELYDIIFYEVILTVCMGLAAVFLIALVFLPHPVGALIVTPVVAAIYIELLGLLYVADIYVNSVSAVGLTMSIGLVVDYNMHIVLTYFEIDDAQTRDERVRKTLSTMGKSILLGGFSTFLGVLPLSMSSSEIFRTFFITFIGIVSFGVGHGLIFTPVVLSLIAPHDPPEGTGVKEPIEPKTYPPEETAVAIVEKKLVVAGSREEWEDLSISSASA